MTISNFVDKINLLKTVDENQWSIDLDEQGKLKRIEKRSFFANFIHWFIHLITCTRVPRNARLDEVTQQILKEADEIYKSLNGEERIELTNALTKLEVINEQNGGVKCAKIKTLAAKIRELKPVKNLINSNPGKEKVNVEEEENFLEPPVDLTVPVIPEVPISDEMRLQNLLRDLKARNVFDTEIANEVGALLLLIKSSVELSPEESYTLCRGLRNLKHEWIAENAKKLSPEITRFIIEKSFQGEGYIVTKVFEALITEPVNKENLAAWVHAFPPFKPESLPERPGDREFINSQLGCQKNEWMRVSDELFYNGKLTGKILEDNLSSEDVKIFLHNFFGFEAYKNSSAYLDKRFDWALNLTDQLNAENRLFLLNVLCYAKHRDGLVKVLRKSLPEDHMMQRILDLNSASENKNSFLKSFIHEMFHNKDEIPQFLSKVKKHLFDDLPANHKLRQELVSWLSVTVTLNVIEQIPLDILKGFYDSSLLSLAQAATQLPNEAQRNAKLTLIVSVMEWTDRRLEDLINYKMDLCIALLPFLSSDAQAQLISIAIDGISSEREPGFYQKKFAGFIEEAKKLDFEVWEEAGKKAPVLRYQSAFKSLPVQYRAAIINGKTEEKYFFRGIFEEMFAFEEIFASEIMPKEQKELIALLKPEVFEFPYPDQIKPEIWLQFFKMMGDTPDDHEKKLLIHASSHLFNNLPSSRANYLGIIKHSQINLLPLETYQVHIHLILSILADKWDENMANIVNQMTPEQERDFLDFFKPFYQIEPSKLRELVEWLVGLDPKPTILNASIKTLIQADISIEERCRLLKDLPTNIIEGYIAPSDIKMLNEQFFVLIKKMDSPKLRLLMEKMWDQLMERSYEYKHNFPYALLLPLVDEADKLKKLLDTLVSPTYVAQIAHMKSGGYLYPIFHHLERHPWKLYLTLGSEFVNKITSLQQWINDSSKNPYPICRHYIENYETEKLTKDQCDEINEQLQTFFNLTKENNFEEAALVHDSLKYNIEKDLVHYASLSTEEICEELPYLNEGQIFAASRIPDLYTKLEQALDHGRQENKLLEETISRIQQILEKGIEHSKI